ncbi:MAG: hypothetical protein ABJD07_06705 [Gemmatimonadaceae bacterium]
MPERTSDFPRTRDSVIAGAASDDAAVRARSLEAIAESYWRPAYKYLRLRWHLEREDAEDLTQDFFATACDRDLFARYDPAAARFRTYLRVCLDSVAKNARAASLRLKRGGGVVHLALDFAGAEGELAGARALEENGPDEFFRREWLRSLFTLAVHDLRILCESAGKSVHFELFDRYDLGAGRATYAELAAEHALPVTQVTNHLAFARREFRRLLLARLRAQCASDAEFREEARELLGVDVT